jgi:hypothetical protein
MTTHTIKKVLSFHHSIHDLMNRVKELELISNIKVILPITSFNVNKFNPDLHTLPDDIYQILVTQLCNIVEYIDDFEDDNMIVSSFNDHCRENLISYIENILMDRYYDEDNGEIGDAFVSACKITDVAIVAMSSILEHVISTIRVELITPRFNGVLSSVKSLRLHELKSGSYECILEAELCNV